MTDEGLTDVARAFAVLGPERHGATVTTARSAYRRRMRVVHPDRFHGTPQQQIAEEESKRVNQAFEVVTRYLEQSEVREATVGVGDGRPDGRERRARCWRCGEVQSVVARVAEIRECIACGVSFQVTFSEGTLRTAPKIRER